MDLFEHYKKMPKNLANICDKWGEIQASNGLDYKDCANFLKEVNSIGYTFEYGLDAEPLNLHKK